MTLECSGPCANISALCDCGCGVYGTGVHIVRAKDWGDFQELAESVKVYAGKCCPVHQENSCDKIQKGI